MAAGRRIALLIWGGIVAVVLKNMTAAPAHSEEMLFDRGLPAENLNNIPGQPRSNVRWRAGVENESYYGDDFIVGSPGERYTINHIRTWVVLGNHASNAALSGAPQQAADDLMLVFSDN